MKIIYLLFSLLLFSFSWASGNTRAQSVRGTVRENLAAVKSCYDDSVKKNPNLAGKVVLEWDVDDTGSVKRALVKTSTLNDPDTENCMLDKLKATKFPPAAKGITTNIIYPFVFAKVK